jgi:hypothetical protein
MPLDTINHTGSVDKFEKSTMRNPKPKFPFILCKGDHFLRDFPGLPKVLKIWCFVSSTPIGHVGDTPSASDVKVGKKKRTIKFPCILCEGDHYSHLCPRIYEAYYLLEKIQIPTGDHDISSNPSLVNGLVNLVPSLDILVDQVVNPVSYSVETLTKVVDPVLSLINPTPPLKSETKVVDLVLSSVDPTSHSKIGDFSQVYLINTDSPGKGDTLPNLMAPPSSNHMISINWNHLTEPCLPSYVPFQITVQVFDRNIPKTIIDEFAYVSILSMNFWHAFGSLHIVPLTQNMLTFDRRVSKPLGILPLFLVTLGGKTFCIDVMVVHDPLEFNLLLGKDYV